MFKILLRTVCCVAAIIFTANADEVSSKEPRVLSTKDAEKIKEHLDRIVGQVTDSKKSPIILSAKADSLTDAQKLVQELLKKDRNVAACVEHDGWLIVGIVQADDLRLSLHEGYAVKKGGDDAYYFGFW